MFSLALAAAGGGSRPGGLAGRPLRRGNPRNCKYASQQKRLGQPWSLRAGEPGWTEAAPKASQKNPASTEEQPAVALCDISQSFDALSQDCGYTLPDVLRTKVVRCFKQEMRAGFRSEPGRWGRDTSRKEESLLAGSQQSCTPAGWRRFKCAERPGSRTVTASVDSGLEGAQSLAIRKAQPTCSPPAGANTSASDGGRWESPPGRSGAQSSAPVNGVCGKFCGEVSTPTDSGGSGTFPPVGADPRAETCQRARVYFRKSLFSCARTDLPWPCAALRAEPPHTGSSSGSAKKQEALGGPPGSTQWVHHQKGEGRRGLLPGGSGDPPPGNTHSAQTCAPSNGTGVHGSEASAHISSPSPSGGHQGGGSGTPPPPSAVVRSSMGRTGSLDSMSPPPSVQPRGGSSASPDGACSPCPNPTSLERQPPVSEGAQMFPCSSSSSSDSFHSSESSMLLPQDRRDRDEEPISRSPRLLPHSEGSPTDAEHNAVHSVLCGTCGETDNALPPMLPPIISPGRRSWRSLLSWSPGSSERKEEDICRHTFLQLAHGNSGKSSVGLRPGSEGSAEALKLQFAPIKQVGPEPSSPSSCADVSSGPLDEVTAYKRDILLIDATQDDPELFENLPQEGLLRLGPVRFSEELLNKRLATARKRQPPHSDGAPAELGARSIPVLALSNYDSADDTEESSRRPWRPPSGALSRAETHREDLPDANNNRAAKSSERHIFSSEPVKSLNPLHSHNPAALSKNNGPSVSHAAANSSEIRRQKSNSYCWKYFSEFMTCGYKTCRFQHVPLAGDEKFCFEIISRFSKNPMCLHKAKAVFTSYYLNNPPGVCFSMPVLSSLLWALLKAGMVSDILAILNVSVAHKIAPGHEVVLALFNLVREKGHVSLLPELMQLMFKMSAAGLVLSLDWMDGLPSSDEGQPATWTNSGKGAAPAPCLGYLNVAHAVVEVELCAKLEDWRLMGGVFVSACQSIQRPNQLEQVSGRVAVALLSESNDKQAVPFAAFAETVCQKEKGHMTRTYLGRIGVSLMLRYHKTRQWAKGRRVAEMLSLSKINYPTLKGLFGNEDGASRCFLVTMATELFLLSGSIEGALNTLRENSWFLSSSSWPCEPADVESRIRLLLRLAERTSGRGTLEVLRNLPGLKEPNDLVNVSNYCSAFNAHLLVCVDRQALPVASDLVDLMLAKRLPVEPTLLHALLQKLGKQNFWLRAREVFRYSLSQGYYQGVSAPPGFMALMVPCRLEEVELALAFEMFITVNGSIILHPAESSSSLRITLKRTQSGESEYLSAGSRLLSAASIPQPNLIIHYTAVNASQEQVFTMDVSSARSWLRHNHLWANDVWTHGAQSRP